MNPISDLIKESRKIVIKIGSNVLSDDNGAVNREVLHNIVEQVSNLIEHHKQVIMVSSGAGICGVGAINKWSRRGDMNYKQALCAIGQVELMMAYKEYFSDYGIHVGQILLTREDFLDPHRTLNIPQGRGRCQADRRSAGYRPPACGHRYRRKEQFRNRRHRHQDRGGQTGQPIRDRHDPFKRKKAGYHQQSMEWQRNGNSIFGEVEE